MTTQSQNKHLKALLLLIVVIAPLGWIDNNRTVECQKLVIKDKQGRLRFEIDSTIRSYNTTGKVRGVYR